MAQLYRVLWLLLVVNDVIHGLVRMPISRSSVLTPTRRDSLVKSHPHYTPKKVYSVAPSSPEVSTLNSTEEPMTDEEYTELTLGLDKEFAQVAAPAFVSLAADPLASLVDAMYVGKLGAVEQAGMGIAISAQFSIAKLYNDPLLKTSTSLVANKEGDELSSSVATSIMSAIIIGILQCILFLTASGPIMQIMGVGVNSEMRAPALKYLKWRALGVPAATVLLVTNGIFRGRGDTKTPLYCTTLGNLVNIILGRQHPLSRASSSLSLS